MRLRFVRALGGVKRFQKINILFISFFILSMIVTILKANEESSFASVLPFIIFFLVFSILVIIGDKNVTRKIQVIFLLMISYFVIITNPIVYQVGYLLLIFIYFLSKKYTIFLGSIKLFEIFLLLFLIISIYLSLQNYGLDTLTVIAELHIWHVINQLLFILATIILIYIVFEDDIKRLTLENKKLTIQIDKSKVFVNLGENIAGLIHNMNGDIGLISMSVSLLEEQVDHKAVEYINSSNKKLQAKIRNILTLAKYSQIEEDIDFSINALLHSLLEVFSINKDFKRIKIKKEFNDEVMFFGNVSEISQIFENLIKNSYEALIENWLLSRQENRDSYTPMLDISIKGDVSEIRIVFSDNGPGIKVCLDRNCEQGCMNCRAFKVGRTTKTDGSGLGMVSVLRTLKKYKGDLKVNTSPEGSEISVILPRPASVSAQLSEKTGAVTVNAGGDDPEN